LEIEKGGSKTRRINDEKRREKIKENEG